LLKDHLFWVWQLANDLYGGRQISIWNKRELHDLLAITTLTHDFGKATRYFQHYILKGDAENKKSGPLERHSLLSAVVGYFLAKIYLEKHQEVDKLSFFVFLAIKRHHGNLHDITDEYASFGDDEEDLLLRQIKALDEVLLQETLEPIIPNLPVVLAHLFPLNRNILESWICSMEQELKHIRRKNIKEKDFDTILFGNTTFPVGKTNYNFNDYFRFLFLYSLLIDADKHQAGMRSYITPLVELPSNLVDSFKKTQEWSPSQLNNLREEAYQEVAGNIKLADQGNIFSINLPTGLGKTLAAYNFAFKLRERRYRERGIAPRIIYTLPFLTVIDQNHKVLSEVLQSQGLMGNHVLIKHHHLSDAAYSLPGENDEVIYSPNAAKLLIEGWAAEIVVTTFVQLFETLIGWRNSSLRRFHRLAHAIIILDEIQAIPVPYWPLIEEMLRFLANHIATDIILVSATQPKIFSSPNIVSNLDEPTKYFDRMERVKLEINLSPRSIIDFVKDELNAELTANPQKSFLFILNTISSAKTLYRELTLVTDEPIAFLSTGVVMKERKLRIEAIRNKKYRLVVSTQLIEAGVDIDFNIVYRDFAPMDSINQSAGRCNRNALGTGIVRLICLCNEKGRSYASMIYDDVALDITRELLKGRTEAEEKDFYNLINIYFKQAKSKILKQSDSLLEAIQNLRFFSDDNAKTGINSFHLIKENGRRGNVFIELDQYARELWAVYTDILKIRDFYQRENSFLAIKKDFYEYVISIPVDRYDSLPPEINHFLYVCHEQLHSYYDQQLGYDYKGIDIDF